MQRHPPARPPNRPTNLVPAAAELPASLKSEGAPPFLGVGVVTVTNSSNIMVSGGVYTGGVRSLLSPGPDGGTLMTTGARAAAGLLLATGAQLERCWVAVAP